HIHSFTSSLFLFTHPPPPQLYTLSLHYALPISCRPGARPHLGSLRWRMVPWMFGNGQDRAVPRNELTSPFKSVRSAIGGVRHSMPLTPSRHRSPRRPHCPRLSRDRRW